MMNSKVFGLILTVVAAASIVAVATGFQNAVATVENAADLDVAETAEATMMTNQTTTSGNMTDVQFLAIQNAQSGSLSEVNATTYTLSLNKLSNDTILFSDRPERIVTSVSTNDFIGNWTAGLNSFVADAPNAALVTENTQTGELETTIFELFNPMYNTTINTLTYTVRAEYATSIAWPGEFAQAVLVIDATSDSKTGSSALCAGCGGRQCPPC